jgi:hypothetical protein
MASDRVALSMRNDATAVASTARVRIRRTMPPPWSALPSAVGRTIRQEMPTEGRLCGAANRVPGR